MNYLYSQYHADGEMISVTLRNLSTNEVLHRWEWDYDDLARIYDRWLDERRANYKTFGDLWDALPRTGLSTPTLLEHNRLVAQVGRTLCCFDADGKLEWSLEHLKHHSVEVDHEGRLWFCSIVPDKDGTYREDLLVRVDSETGSVLFEKKLKEIFACNPEHDFSHHNRDNVDPYHLNDIQPVMSDSAHWRSGDLFLSLRNISRVLLYRPSTGKILWSNATYWSQQHDVDVVNGETITVFDNNLIKDRPQGDYRFKHGEFNRCVTFNFRTGRSEHRFADIFAEHGCQTITQGRLKWFEKDDLLYIEPGDQDFFVVADLKTNRSYKCIIRGNSSGKAGRTIWFRLVG